MSQRALWKSSSEHFGRSRRSRRIHNGASFVNDAPSANLSSISYPPRTSSSANDTLGLIVDCGSLCIVHGERGVTEMLDPPAIPGTWSPGDEPSYPIKREKLPYFQSTIITEYFALVLEVSLDILLCRGF